MRRPSWVPLGILLAVAPAAAQGPPASRGVIVEQTRWDEVEPVLSTDGLLLVPVARAADHGPHLRSAVDRAIVEHLAARLARTRSLVVAPTLAYETAPAPPERTGALAIPADAAVRVLVEISRSVARSGPRRVLALGIGGSEAAWIGAAARELAAEGVLLRGADLRLGHPQLAAMRAHDELHGSETETSMMLAIDQAAVDMTRAQYEHRALPQVAGGRLVAVTVDPRRATPERGRQVIELLVGLLEKEVDELRAAALPSGATAPAVASRPLPGAAAPGRPAGSEGDDRGIRQLAPMFENAWMRHDAWEIAGLWIEDGDMMHPDGTVERGRQSIAQNRAALFAQRRYQGSRHPLTIRTVRFRGPDVAVVDGRWELTQYREESGQGDQASMEGLFTWVVQRAGARWRIAAWRYTVGEPATARPSR
jgi:uncharacterized protein (TIGR02246 family)